MWSPAVDDFLCCLNVCSLGNQGYGDHIVICARKKYENILIKFKGNTTLEKF